MSSGTTNLPKHDLPKHIAIIMDGNNRYGKQRGLAHGEGHRFGKSQLDEIVSHCRATGLQVLTVFAFSSENWERPAHEVALLMELFEHTIIEQLPRMLKNGIRMRFIGERSRLSERIKNLMADAEAKTAHLTAMTLVIAVSYGGQWDVFNAAKQMALSVANGELDASAINMDDFHQFTALSDLPPVDLLIRTGGEWRISNFLLWQSAYAELYFTDVLWPDFTKQDIDKAIVFFQSRQRRFGKTSEQVESEQMNK